MIPTHACDHLFESLGERIRFDVPMAHYTSLRVGGKADAVATPVAVLRSGATAASSAPATACPTPCSAMASIRSCWTAGSRAS